MNFTWYATAFDQDDWIHRLLTMLLMFGGLTFAAGVGAFFEDDSLVLMLLGYVFMKAVLALMWLRIALGHESHMSRRALIQAAGLLGLQVLWVAAYFGLAGTALYTVVVVLIALECALPTLANRVAQTPIQLEHLVERHGLLTIIVLGEGFSPSSSRWALSCTMGSLPGINFSLAPPPWLLWEPCGGSTLMLIMSTR